MPCLIKGVWPNIIIILLWLLLFGDVRESIVIVIIIKNKPAWNCGHYFKWSSLNNWARRHTPEQFNAPAENNFRIQIVYSTSYNTFIHSLIYPPKVKFRRTSKAAGDISTWKRKTFLPVCNIPTTHSCLPVFVPTLLQDHSSHNEINVQLLLQIIPTTEYKSILVVSFCRLVIIYAFIRNLISSHWSTRN